jgi:hypothetical protein
MCWKRCVYIIEPGFEFNRQVCSSNKIVELKRFDFALRSMRTQVSRCGNTFAFAIAIFCSTTVQLQCLLRAPERKVTEKANVSALIVGLAGDRTQATCVARFGANRSAIHYDFIQTIRITNIIIGESRSQIGLCHLPSHDVCHHLDRHKNEAGEW